MGRYSVKRYKTKRMTRQLDQIFDDLSTPESIQKLKNQEEDETLPGMGQYYCVQCAKYFFDNTSLKGHIRGKVHKRRVKELKIKPYTPEEADFAAGVNVEKYLDRVNKYKNEEEQRRLMEAELLKNQTEEYELRDRQKWEQMYPEKAVEEAQKKLEQESLEKKRALKKAQKYELEPLTDDEIQIDP